MKQLGALLSMLTWLLVAGSVVIIAGGLFGRPLLLAAVPTGSMVPVFSPGDLIVVLPTWAVPAPGQGDIVVYRTKAPGDWIVHRIVGGSPAEGFVTRGDANPVPDPSPVRPGDIAGVVPQVGGHALHFPRLGLLSSGGGGILSSPIVAGVALAMGVYLLALDVKPAMRMPRLPIRQRGRARPEAIVSIYLGLAGTALLTTLIPAWTLSTSQRLAYEVVAQRPLNAVRPGRVLPGEVYSESVPVSNPSPLPLVVVFKTGDPNAGYDPDWALLPGRGRRNFTLRVKNTELGSHASVVQMGVFLPLLPPGLLAWLAQRSMALAAVATAVTPALAVLAIAILDRRTRWLLHRLRARALGRTLS